MSPTHIKIAAVFEYFYFTIKKHPQLYTVDLSYIFQVII